ncbi:sigma-70 family RNA polymerase sigma factor [Clostridium drakei]
MELVSKMDSSKNIKAYIKLAKKGDRDAFIRIIENSKASMYRIAVGILNSPQDVEDAFQNTIIKSYEGIIHLKKNEYFKTWLIRILINECNAILRSNHKIIPIEEVQDNAKVTNEFSKLELTSAVNSLSEDLRIVTTLFYFEDIPQKDIAKILDIPEGTVRSRLSRARNKLYEMLKEY